MQNRKNNADAMQLSDVNALQHWKTGGGGREKRRFTGKFELARVLLNQNRMKSKNSKLAKQTLTLGACALFAFTVPLHADDNNGKDNSGDNKEQASQKADNGNKVDNGDGGDNNGGKISPFQSSADPYGLKKAGPVMEAGSTATSAQFDKTLLPEALKFCAQYLPDGRNNLNSPAVQIDPNKLVLATKQAVTATFISESAGFHNSVGFSTVAAGGKDPQNWWAQVTDPTAKLVFPDVSSPEDFNAGGAYSQTRSASQLLLPGDFVNLGTMAKGTKLDFFLIANGANQDWAPVFSSVESINNDGYTHHVNGFTASVFAQPALNSPYVFLTFKDWWGGGDNDINDAVIALNVGKETVKSLLSTPEPAMWLTFGSFLAVAIWAKRRMTNQTIATVA